MTETERTSINEPVTPRARPRTIGDGRLVELVVRLIGPGPVGAHVSASERHEICDGVHEILDARRGAEAEDLRSAIEAIAANPPGNDEDSWIEKIRHMLDEVDARDSVAWLESIAHENRQVSLTRFDRLVAKKFHDGPMANRRTSESALEEALKHLGAAIVEIEALDRRYDDEHRRYVHVVKEGMDLRGQLDDIRRENDARRARGG